MRPERSQTALPACVGHNIIYSTCFHRTVAKMTQSELKLYRLLNWSDWVQNGMNGNRHQCKLKLLFRPVWNGINECAQKQITKAKWLASVKLACKGGISRMMIFRDFVPVLCKHATNSDFHSGFISFRSHVNRTYVDRVKATISYVHSKKRREKPKNRRCMNTPKEAKGNLY